MGIIVASSVMRVNFLRNKTCKMDHPQCWPLPWVKNQHDGLKCLLLTRHSNCFLNTYYVLSVSHAFSHLILLTTSWRQLLLLLTFYNEEISERWNVGSHSQKVVCWTQIRLPLHRPGGFHRCTCLKSGNSKAALKLTTCSKDQHERWVGPSTGVASGATSLSQP